MSLVTVNLRYETALHIFSGYGSLTLSRVRAQYDHLCEAF
jgi:hypothetical protein